MSLDRYEPDTIPQLVTAQDVAVRRLAEWARSAEAAHHIAETLVRTSFVPEAFRNKPGEATAAILAGLEVGLQPMAALRSFDVIQGQAAPRALTLRAVVQSAGHSIELEESTATTCKMRGRRAGTHTWQTVRWTTDRARSLNLLGKQNWKLQPQAMLVARATSELCRLIAADAILGIGYTIEELADGTGAGIETQLPPAPADPTEQPAVDTGNGKRKMSRTRAKPAPHHIQMDPEPDDEPADTNIPTRAQTTKAMALFGELDITDRQERLTATSAIVGRDITSWSGLTRDEASTVIDQLQRTVDETPEPVDPNPAELNEDGDD
jgi:hypothetical protein